MKLSVCGGFRLCCMHNRGTVVSICLASKNYRFDYLLWNQYAYIHWKHTFRAAAGHTFMRWRILPRKKQHWKFSIVFTMFTLTYIQLSAFTTFTFMSILYCFTKSAIVLNVNNFLYIYQLSDYRIIQKLIIRFSISLNIF